MSVLDLLLVLCFVAVLGLAYLAGEMRERRRAEERAREKHVRLLRGVAVKIHATGATEVSAALEGVAATIEEGV